MSPVVDSHYFPENPWRKVSRRARQERKKVDRRPRTSFPDGWRFIHLHLLLSSWLHQVPFGRPETQHFTAAICQSLFWVLGGQGAAKSRQLDLPWFPPSRMRSPSQLLLLVLSRHSWRAWAGLSLKLRLCPSSWLSHDMSWNLCCTEDKELSVGGKYCAIPRDCGNVYLPST